MRSLHHSVVIKRELSRKAKLSVFKSVFVSILTYGHESWIMTERVRSHMASVRKKFLWKIEGVAMFDKHRNTAIWESLNIESLLLRIERSQLRWFGHVSRMTHEQLPKQILYAKENWRRPHGRPRTTWLDYIDNLGWNRLGGHPGELQGTGKAVEEKKKLSKWVYD